MVEKFKQYSKAIYEISNEQSDSKELINLSIELIDIDKKINLFKYLGSYSISTIEKHQLIDELKIENKIYNNWLHLLIDSGLSKKIKQCINEFINIYYKENNISKGYILTTELINREHINKLEEVISKKLNRETILENKIDKTIIGGIRVEIDDVVWDNTIKNKLHKLFNEGMKE